MQRFSAGPRLLLTVCALTAASMLIAEDDESLTARYFDQMRQRGLFSLAESHAESRLTDPLLSPARRMELVIELSRTLVAHAVAAGDDQQAELWEKAAAVLAEELAATGESPRRIVLEVYAGLVPAARAEQLAWDVEASPFEEPYREALDRVCADALRKLARVEESLAGRIRSLEGRKKSSAEISVHELRQLLSLTRWKEGTTLLAKARLSPPGSQERHSDVLDADERFRKVLGSGSERWHAAARLGLATGNRLRDEFGRALEMLDQLERDQKMKEAGLADALRLERVRILLQTQQPAAAADELLQMRTGRDRLPGEFWLAQFQALSALRRAASQRSASALVAQLDEQAQKDLKFVDAQAGGVWSRRCRAIWSGTQSVERYGQRLAAQLAKAQAEYLAGRIDSAMTAYAAAVEWAHEDGKSDVEMDVGYTLAAVLAKGGRWEEAARRCRQLVAAHPDHPQAAEIDMFGLHAAGRSLDEQPSDERRTAYAEALAEHLRRFPGSSTVSEAEYLRGRLLEAGGHPAEAMAAYLRVKPDHVRSAAASAAVGRCLVAQLLLTRESGKTDLDLERQSLELVAQRLRGLPEQPPSWNDEQAELAYQAVKLYLLLAPPRFNDAERWLDRLDQATSTSDETAEPDGVRAELRRRSGPLRLVALAGLGRAEEAERLLGTLEGAPALDLLSVVEELSRLEIPHPPPARRRLAEMQLASAEALDRRRSELTRDQQRRLDLALARSYLATSQPKKAVSVYQTLLDNAPKDAELARHVGQVLLGREELGCRALARVCWQRVENLQKQGSPSWLEARSRVIEASLLLGDFEQARKLLKVTKLLYPQLGGDELRRRYAALEAQLP